MDFHGKRSRTVAAVMGGAMVATLGLAASPASAKISDGWVRGYDRFSDDWDDEGDLGRLEAEPNSNATCLLQRILWAEGAYATDYDNERFTEGDIDGYFGWRTFYSLRDVQKGLAVTPDGIAGGTTLGLLNKHMYQTGGSTARGKTLYLTYQGKRHSFDLSRNSEGKYVFPDGNGDSRQAGYKYLTCG
ncbi:peptidoglycan-binding domain-containing protein [Streptomyces pratensis]|uniref:peptidoglycan-binding domain-containing protein n=1 Tax=Streptomyces pratensis TaxID=1169025 RepID=UPI00193286DB|nr:peptidoglycan-binding domain-containing protein [Streptomyces pratensis]